MKVRRKNSAEKNSSPEVRHGTVLVPYNARCPDLHDARIQEFGGDDPETLIWLDKACIDQQNIDASLAVLPIFLAGCKSLLVLPGSTYATRLW